jgi:U3 small nucleolar RNA-associated protein 3
VEKDDKTAEKDKKIVKDLDQMSQKEKLKLLKKESPEMLELIQDFKAKVNGKAFKRSIMHHNVTRRAAMG